jgi:hypothetical protein
VSRASAWNLDAATYKRHSTHSDSSAWLEKNCYIDVWIEVLHARGLDPMAVMPFTLATDFEGDQWTFFKPPHGDLRTLYGVDTQELNVWRTLADHSLTHLREGRVIFSEADAWWLPDTRGTDYRTQHTKSTIVIETIDLDARRLGYFHNAGYFELEGEDFARTFRLDIPHDPAFMPFFAEVARFDRSIVLPQAELVARSKTILRECLARRPQKNPIERFKGRFVEDIEQLKREGIARYHAYAFATIRQIGAGFELASNYVRWLEANGEPAIGTAAADLEAISSNAKSLILKGARAVGANKAVDFSPMLDAMSASWDRAMSTLDERFRL